MPKSRSLNIVDWYVHQGHQYEFFKTGHSFHLTGMDGTPAKWNENHRPLGKNVKLIREGLAKRKRMDIVMVRSPVNAARAGFFHRNGAKGVAVIQTTDPFRVPSWVRHVVWNSYESMRQYKGSFPGKKHYYIPHGYSPSEFCDMGLDRGASVLTVVNSYKKRRALTGYDIWKHIGKNFDSCKIVGHGNKDISKDIKEASTFKELLSVYNSHGIYVNTTIKSAMPRSRAEAAMCGMPIVSTDNYGIKRYFKHKKSALLTNDKDEMVKYIKMLLASKQMREDYGSMAREVAIKNFNLKEYLNRWDRVFRDVFSI